MPCRRCKANAQGFRIVVLDGVGDLHQELVVSRAGESVVDLTVAFDRPSRCDLILRIVSPG